MTPVEYRNRSRRAPGGDFRIVLGEPSSGKELRRFERRRELCKRIALRGEWDVLQALKDRLVAFEEVERLIDSVGWDNYRALLTLDRPVLAPSLDAHVERWLDTLDKPGTRAVYAPHLVRLRDFEVDGERLGLRPWPTVHRHHIRDAFAEVKAELAWNTARTCLGAWGSFFTWAVEREASEAEEASREPLIVASPVKLAKRWGTSKTTRHRFFQPNEYRRLLAGASDPMRAQYATLTFTGLRIREFTVLPPVHLKAPDVISVGPWGDWVPKGYPRSTRGVRDIPIHRAELLPLLEDYAERFAGEVSFFVNPRTGEPWSYTAFADQMRKDVAAAGMVYGQREGGETRPEGVTPHTFRHTFASWLCQADVSLLKVAKLIGDTVETVQRHYAHLVPTDLDRAVNRLEV